MKQTNYSESGQAIVLLVISLVVLLGFTALALDGGMAYSDRRHAQNGADTAALAGGGAAASFMDEEDITWESWARCTEALSSARAAAIERALTNSYEIHEWNGTEEDTNYVRAECTSTDLKVTVVIEKDTQTSFAHLLFSGPLRNKVAAVTQIKPESPLFAGNSIVALKDTECNSSDGWGIELGGTADVYLSGGGAYSYSCLYGNGTTRMYVTGGSISYEDSVIDPGTPLFDPAPVPVAEEDSLAVDTILPPDCSGFTVRQSSPGNSCNSTISQGWYESIKCMNGSLTMNPGLYCIDNNFDINGATVIGHGVTIYSETGSFSVTANSNADLSAPKDCDLDDTDNCPPAIENVLVYMENGDVTMRGTALALYTGTIYAPKGNVDIGGTSDALSLYNVQIIGYTVNLYGTPETRFVFNSEDNFRIPGKLGMYR
jgi:hypothetical protein